MARQISQPLLTCDAVLAETAFHLRDCGIVLRLIDTGFVRPDFEIAANLARLLELAERYRDRKPDLADLCLIRLSEIHPKLPILTTDARDFRVYRRNRREAIPLIVPPAAK